MQLAPKLRAIVDFAVKCDRCPVAVLCVKLAHHGLTAAFRIENGKTDVGKTDMVLQIDAFRVRTTVLLCLTHFLKDLIVFSGGFPIVYVMITKAGDSAHVGCSFLNCIL